MKLSPKHPTRQGGKRRRRLELVMFASVDVDLPLAQRQSVERDPNVRVDSLTRLNLRYTAAKDRQARIRLADQIASASRKGEK